METEKYQRKTFIVNAVQVTEENMAEIAVWTSGNIVQKDDAPGPYVDIDTHQPINERQTQAYIDDWVLETGGTFKIFTPKAFKKNFEPVFQETEPAQKYTINVG